MPNLSCRLIHACRLAYAINSDGSDFDNSLGINVTNEINAVGFDNASFKIFQSPNDHSIDACYAGYVKDLDATILAFRGTLPPSLDIKDTKEFVQVLLDWLNDGKIEQVAGEDLPGKVHQGFLHSLNNLWSSIKAFQIPLDKPLYITGHSKGGALAYLAAARWQKQFSTVPTGVYTYAAPRVGNQQFALAYDTVMKELTHRFEYRDDLVPHLPPHTGTWLQAFKAGGGINSKIAPFIHGEALSAKTDFDGLLKRVELIIRRIDDHTYALESYVSAGTLRFINWNQPPKIENDAWGLAIKRDLHLAEMLLTFRFAEIIKDHSSNNGYLSGPCG